MHTASLLIALTLPMVLVGQEPTRTLPKAAHHAWGNSTYKTNSSVKQFTLQNWYSGANLPVGTVINAIAFRGHPTLTSSAYTTQLEVTFVNTTLDAASLSTQLANNLGSNAVIAFQRRLVSIPARPAASHPNDAGNHWMVLDTPFVFTGPNLIIQIDETQRVSTGWQHILGTNMPNPTLHLTVSQTKCGGSLNAQYLSGAYDLTVTGVPANSPLWFLFGVENTRSGGIVYPLDLTAFGMAGCALGLDPLVVVGQVANSAGQANLQIPYALLNKSLLISAQVLHYSSTNATATTNAVTSVLGQFDSWNQVPSFNGTTSLPGYPSPGNSGVPLLIR